jgi:hypothetical protein
LLARFHGLFPGTTADVLGLVNRFVLPGPDEAGTAMVRGAEAQQRQAGTLWNTLTAWGLSAARRFQHSGGGQEAPARDRQARTIS